jgi:glutathione S-transferase
MVKVWGRNNSINVQKVMWALGELGLAHERIDIGGPFGMNKEPPYLAKNPNGLVPTLEEDDGFLLWESNSIVRYLAAKHGAGKLEPKDPKARALAHQWMDWQLTVAGPAIFHTFWGLVRTPPEKRDHKAIAESQAKTTEAMKMVDAALGKSAFLAGEEFSMGDIPPALTAFRFRKLVPDRPAMANLERWYGAIEQRPAFRDHVLAVPFT